MALKAQVWRNKHSLSPTSAMSPSWSILLICVLVTFTKCENILLLHPIYCGSHEFVLRTLGDHLVSRGHTVTQVWYTIAFIEAIKDTSFIG